MGLFLFGYLTFETLTAIQSQVNTLIYINIIFSNSKHIPEVKISSLGYTQIFFLEKVLRELVHMY
jgi:hypothetical protein